MNGSRELRKNQNENKAGAGWHLIDSLPWWADYRSENYDCQISYEGKWPMTIAGFLNGHPEAYQLA